MQPGSKRRSEITRSEPALSTLDQQGSSLFRLSCGLLMTSSLLARARGYSLYSTDLWNARLEGWRTKGRGAGGADMSDV